MSDIKPITRESFLAAHRSAAPLSAKWPATFDRLIREWWDLLHERDVMADEIDEDPVVTAGFSETTHAQLATLFDVPGYRGYKPAVLEAPNGDTKACIATPVTGSHRECYACDGTGRVPNVDHGKRYLHVALKYDPPEWALRHLARAHWEACRVAEALRVPDAFYPRVENGTLRVLEYSAGAGSAEHRDFDLFTLNLWRSTPDDHEQWHEYGQAPADDPGVWERGAAPYHIGELGELVGLGKAAPHRVPARPYAQRAIVYFAMPAGAAILGGTRGPRKCFNCKGSGIVASQFEYMADKCYCVDGFGPMTVAEWVAERTARSRVPYP